MNRTSFKSFTRAGMSMTTIAISIASVLALSGCGSTGGSLSKTDGGGVASNGTKGTATNGSNGAASSATTAPTNTGTNTGVTGTAPDDSAMQASTSVWNGIVGGVGNVVMQAGNTVSAAGTSLELPGLPSSSPIGDNAVSAIVIGAGGAVYGVGKGLTTGLEGISSGTDPIDAWVQGFGKASALVGQSLSDGGSAIRATGAGMPYSSYFSPAFVVVGSGVSSTGSGLSALQFDAAATLTDATVQQLTSAVAPVVYPAVTGAIEIGSVVGDRTGLGAPVNTLFTDAGGSVATVGSDLAVSSSSPVVQQLGGTVIATGNTVAAVGGVLHDGQSSSITPIGVTSISLNGIVQGVTLGLSSTPGAAALTSTLSGVKASVTPAVSGLLGAASSALTPVGTSVAPGAAVISTTVSAAAAPVVAISTTLTAPVNGTSTPQTGTLIPVLAPVIVPVSTLVSSAAATSKGNSTLPSLSGTLAHPGH